MKRTYSIWLLCLYVGLLLLASTRFGIVSWIGGPWDWSWDYFLYAYENGWGYTYESDFSFWVVLTYLAAFTAGLRGHRMAGKRIAGVCSTLAVILCIFGLASFLVEGSHFLLNHRLSLIAICPAASLLLACIAIVQLGRAPRMLSSDSSRGV